VKYLKNHDGLFVNTRSKNIFLTNRFIKCTNEGKINLFMQSRELLIPNMSQYNYLPLSQKKTRDISYTKLKVFRSYYSVGLGEIKKPRYCTLAPIMQNSSDALACLKEYRNQTWMKNIFLVSGLGALTGGILTLTKTAAGKGSGHNESATPGTIAIAGGVMCLTVTYFISLSRPAHLVRAVETYNRN
jgi:hypothetical protein